MKKILIPTKLNKIAHTLLTEKGYDVIFDTETDFNELIKTHSDIDALIVRSEKVTQAIIDQLPQLKVIVRAGAGYDNIDIKYARTKKIDVMNTPGANANGVAEEALGMMIAASRHFVPADSSTRQGLWEKKKFSGTEIAGKTIGVVGLGAIGQLLCRRLSGFDVQLLGFDPYMSSDKAKELKVELVDLETLFKQSDCISLHVPETKDTKGFVDQSLLNLVKDGSIIVNCARAGIINEDDLRSVKQSKTIKYCNDVYHKDAAGEKSVTDLCDIMLPHLGASTKESNFNAAKRSALQIIDLWEKGISKYVVNLTIPEELDEEFQKLCFHMTKLARAWVYNKPIRQIETSFYGNLEKFSKWMLSPIVQAIDPSFDIFTDYKEAKEILKEKGIDYTERKPDNAKNYGEAITIELFCGNHQELERISVRGTITEGIMMISRISDFNKLYFNPLGHSLFFTYTDRPAVLGQITSILGEHKINIHDIRAPHNSSLEKSLAIIKVDKTVNQDVIDSIREKINAETAFYIEL